MTGVLIGLDIGTTNLKAGAVTPDGHLLTTASAPTPTNRLPGGGAEYDPEAIWQGAASVLAEVVAALQGRPILGVAVCSMAEAGVLVDNRGRALGPAIAWFDARTRPQAERLEREIGAQAIYEETGHSLQTKFSLLKILWWKENHPAVYAEAVTWLSMMDWIIFRLSGEQVTDRSLACRTMAYEVGADRWATGLLERVGVDSALLPRILPSGSVAGAVHAEAAALTGLPRGTPVVTGGHDHPVASLAAGVTGPGILLDSTGTAEALIGAVAAPRMDAEAFATGLTNSALPAPGVFGLQGGMNASGGSLEWFKRELAPDLDYGALIEAARAAGADPTGLVYLPHLAGSGPPRVDPASKGAFLGLTYGHGRSHLLKAVLEGTVCEVRLIVEAMERLVERRFEKVIVTGGHTRNPVWMQLRADILNRPVTPLSMDDATLLGCALLAGAAVGAHRSIPDAVAIAGGKTGAPIEPRPGIAAQYDAYFHEVYRPVHAALAPIYRALDGVMGS